MATISACSSALRFFSRIFRPVATTSPSRTITAPIGASSAAKAALAHRSARRIHFSS